MKVTQMPPVHAANPVANSGNTAYGVDVIDNNAALVEIMAWRRKGDKPWSEPVVTRFTDACMRH